MIFLTNGYPQGPNGLIVPKGSISFQLNTDGTVIASPGGFVAAEKKIIFQFNAAGQIQPNAPATHAQLYSNLELEPQNNIGLGTYYLVTFYDQNGARLNKNPMWWQFIEPAGSTVDISLMTGYVSVGGNVIYWPIPPHGGSGTVTSVAFVGDGTVLSATPSTPVTISGNIVASLLSQSANAFLAGPATGAAANPTFRAIVPADLPVFGASGSSHSKGAVPDPGSSAGTTRYLREDATWAVAATGPGTPSSAVQFNNSGAFGGDAQFTWDSTNHLGYVGVPRSSFSAPLNTTQGTGQTFTVSALNNAQAYGQAFAVFAQGQGSTSPAYIQGATVDVLATGTTTSGVGLAVSVYVNTTGDGITVPIGSIGAILYAEFDGSGSESYLYGLTGGTGVTNGVVNTTESVHAYHTDTQAHLGRSGVIHNAYGFYGGQQLGGDTFNVIYGGDAEDTSAGHWWLYSPGGNSYHAGSFTFGTAITFKGSVSGSATLGIAGSAGTPNAIQLPTSTGTSGYVLQTDGGNPQQLSWVPHNSGGTVSSFSAGDLSPLFTTGVTNAATTPALSFALNTHTANFVFAGPTTGSAAAPTFRALVNADVPAAGSTTQVQFNASNLLGADSNFTWDNTNKNLYIGAAPTRDAFVNIATRDGATFTQWSVFSGWADSGFDPLAQNYVDKTLNAFTTYNQSTLLKPFGLVSVAENNFPIVGGNNGLIGVYGVATAVPSVTGSATSDSIIGVAGDGNMNMNGHNWEENSDSYIAGIAGQATVGGTGTLLEAAALQALYLNYGETGSPVVTQAVGLHVWPQANAAKAVGITCTSSYGILIDDQGTASGVYSIYSKGGNNNLAGLTHIGPQASAFSSFAVSNGYVPTLPCPSNTIFSHNPAEDSNLLNCGLQVVTEGETGLTNTGMSGIISTLIVHSGTGHAGVNLFLQTDTDTPNTDNTDLYSIGAGTVYHGTNSSPNEGVTGGAFGANIVSGAVNNIRGGIFQSHNSGGTVAQMAAGVVIGVPSHTGYPGGSAGNYAVTGGATNVGVYIDPVGSGTSNDYGLYIADQGAGYGIYVNGGTSLFKAPIVFAGSTMGSAQIGVAASAGTPNALLLPTSTGTSGYVLATDGGNPQQLSWVPQSGSAGSGTVTGFSSQATFSPLFTTSVTNNSTTPALAFAQITQSANLIFAGPTTGSAANPTFRALVAADMPSGFGVGGSNTQLQYNNSGAFGGIADLTFTSPHTIAGGASGIFDFSAVSSFKLPVAAGDVVFAGTGGAASGSSKFAWNNSTNVLTTGYEITILGSSSGSASIGAAAAAGTPNPMLLPTTTGTSGYVLSTDGGSPQQLSWVAQSGGAGGTVTSFSASATFSPLFTTSVSNSTTTPSLSFAQITQSANLIFAGPTTGAAANPTFRALVAADMPSGFGAAGSSTQLQYNNGGVFGGIADLTFTSPHTIAGGASGIFDFSAVASFKLPVVAGDVIYAGSGGLVSGSSNFAWANSTNILTAGYQITLLGSVSGSASIAAAGTAGTPNTLVLPTSTGTAGYVLSTNGSNPQQLSWIPATSGGTVTSFSAGNFSPLFTTSVATAGTTPALSFAAVTQNANLIFAGPTSGGAVAPTFRSLVVADIPNLPGTQITSGQVLVTYGGTGSNLSATGGTHQVLKQTSVGGPVSVALLVAADIPSLAASIITSGTLGVTVGGTGANLSATGGASQVLKQVSTGAAVTVGQLAYSDISGSVPIPASGTLADGSTISFVGSSHPGPTTINLNSATSVRTINFSGLTDGAVYTIMFVQDATGGAQVTLGSGLTWKIAGNGGGTITLNTSPNNVDRFVFQVVGGIGYGSLQTQFT